LDDLNERLKAYARESNRIVKTLQAENKFVFQEKSFKVINKSLRRTITRTEISDYQRIILESEKSLLRDWTRTPRSNSLSFEYRTIQNKTE